MEAEVVQHETLFLEIVQSFATQNELFERAGEERRGEGSGGGREVLMVDREGWNEAAGRPKLCNREESMGTLGFRRHSSVESEISKSMGGGMYVM
jgi:hypothetical protein